MGGLCRALHKDRSPPEGLNQYVAGFEEATFEKATDMVSLTNLLLTYTNPVPRTQCASVSDLRLVSSVLHLFTCFC